MELDPSGVGEKGQKHTGEKEAAGHDASHEAADSSLTFKRTEDARRQLLKSITIANTRTTTAATTTATTI